MFNHLRHVSGVLASSTRQAWRPSRAACSFSSPWRRAVFAEDDANALSQAAAAHTPDFQLRIQ
jgi:hypothetical protein